MKDDIKEYISKELPLGLMKRTLKILFNQSTLDEWR